MGAALGSAVSMTGRRNGGLAYKQRSSLWRAAVAMGVWAAWWTRAWGVVNIYLSLTSPAEQGTLGGGVPTVCPPSSVWLCLYLAVYGVIITIINAGGDFAVTSAWVQLT